MIRKNQGKQTMQVRIVLVLIVFAFALMSGYPAKRSAAEDPQTGMTLIYRIPVNQVFRYQNTTETIQKSETRGGAVEVKGKTSIKFSIQRKGTRDGNLLLRITFDALDMELKSPKGVITPDLSAFIGKGFDILLSPLGKELEYLGTESLRCELGAGRKLELDSFFRFFFPDLPGRKVKIGDTWTSKDEALEKEGDTHLDIRGINVHTMEGIETVNGMECIKFTTKITNTVEGKVKQGEAEVTMNGESTGTSTWYFAYKKGIFVKDITNIVGKSTVTVSDQDSVTPMTTEMKIATIHIE